MMMDWMNDYTAKRTTAADAVRAVRSGDRIYIQPSCATPEDLVRALLGRARELRDVEIIHMKTLGGAVRLADDFVLLPKKVRPSRHTVNISNRPSDLRRRQLRFHHHPARD